MKVYILIQSSGTKHEGGNDIICGVYSSKELAYLEARERIVPECAWKDLDLNRELRWSIPDDCYYDEWYVEEWEVE